MLVGGQPTSFPLPFNSCAVPPGINGPVAVFITSDDQPLINNVVDRATSQLVAGPLIVFVDTQSQILGKTVGITSSTSSSSGGDGGGSGSDTVRIVTTETISPAEASAIISSASVAAASASAIHPS